MKEVECAGVIAVYPPSNRVAVVENAIGKITLPKGTIKSGESPFMAAVRELSEETGLIHGQTVMVDSHELTVCRRPGLSIANPDTPTSQKNIHLFKGVVNELVVLRPTADDVQQAMWLPVDCIDAMLTWPQEADAVINHCLQLGLRYRG